MKIILEKVGGNSPEIWLNNDNSERSCPFVWTSILFGRFDAGFFQIEGVSYWRMQSKSAQRGKKKNCLINSWCLVASGGLGIWVTSTNFQNNDIYWPQQPPTERVSDIGEKLDFWGSVPQKGTGIGHLGAKDNQTIRISKIFDEMRLSRSLGPLRLLRPLRSLRLQRF